MAQAWEKDMKKTKHWHPLYNIIVFSVFGWIYMRGLDAPSFQEAIFTGLIWVPKIVSAYGKEALRIERNRIVVTIPFNKIGVNEFITVSQKVSQKVSNKTEDKILAILRDNPNITVKKIASIIGLSEPGVKKNLKQLKDKKLIRRIGYTKGGY